MSRFLMAVWPGAGHLYPAVAVGRGLQRLGHEVAYHTVSAYESVLAPLGFTVLPLADVPGIDEQGAHPRDDATNPLAMRRAFRERFIDPLPALVQSLQGA